MEEKIPENALRVGIDPEKLNTVFSDHAQIESKLDHVVINFLQSVPAPDDQPNAKIVSRITMSWTQFSQLKNVMDNVLNRDKGKVLDHFTTLLSGDDNDK